jgi:3-dehydroquinate synthase
MTIPAHETAGTRIVVPVALEGRAYDIHIGRHQLCEAAALIAGFAPGAKVALVTDESVAALHAPAFEACLQQEGIASTRITLPPGEATKSYAQFIALCDALLAAKIERDDLVIALGGGVVGDLTGFAAAVLRRGVRFVQIPTTLLAQVDSSVGGKTGINSGHGKNLVGAFHQPALVIADTALLDTLSEREFKAGYAEVVKYGLIDDPAFFAWCEVNGVGVLAGHRDLREQAIITAVRAKARIVAGDVEDRSGKRALLNLGHSFAHSIEAEAGLGNVLHGEAVALGLALAFRFSAELGLCANSDSEQVVTHLHKLGLPTRFADVGLRGGGALLEHIRRDKKAGGGALALVLARGIGKAFLDRSVDERRLGAFLDGAA